MLIQMQTQLVCLI